MKEAIRAVQRKLAGDESALLSALETISGVLDEMRRARGLVGRLESAKRSGNQELLRAAKSETAGAVGLGARILRLLLPLLEHLADLEAQCNDLEDTVEELEYTLRDAGGLERHGS